VPILNKLVMANGTPSMLFQLQNKYRGVRRQNAENAIRQPRKQINARQQKFENDF